MISAARIRTAAWLGVALMPIAGCASPSPAPTSDAVERIDSEGLLCVRYTLDTDAPRMEAVAASYATRLFPTPAERAVLAREGLQVAVVPTAELADIRARLGPLSEVTRLIVGQSANWVEVARRELGADELLTLDGSLRHGGGGALRLSVRDSVTPTTEGGCVHTEVALHLAPVNAPLAPVGGPPIGTLVSRATLECCLQDHETLLILPAPAVPTGKGPATAQDMPPTPGVALLAECSGFEPGRERRGHSVAIALIAKVPPGIRPPPAATVDTPPPMQDTATSPVAPPSP